MNYDYQWVTGNEEFLPVDLREQFLAEAEQSRWNPIDGRHPMSPALMLEAVIPHLRDVLQLLFAEVAYDRAWEVRDDNYRPDPAPDFPDRIGTYTILGVRDRRDVRVWMLDLGDRVVNLCIAIPAKPEERTS